MEPWIVSMCRRTAQRQVVAWLLVLGVFLSVIAVNGRYVRNFFGGPYAMDGRALAAVGNADAAPQYFVALMPTDVLDTGIQETTTTTENGQTTGSYVSAGFYAAKVGESYLIVKTGSKPAGRIVGELNNFPQDLAAQLFSGSDGQVIKQHCYPFYVDASSEFRAGGYVGAGVLLVLVLLLWVFGRRSLARMLRPESHPLVARVSNWGDIHLISHQVESELREGASFSTSAVRFTENFAVQKSLLSFDVYRLNDLLWAYQKVTQHRVNFIPTRKTYAAALKFYGGNLEVQASKESVQDLLAHLAARVPWAVFGFSDDLKKAFAKETAGFCRAVEKRHEEWQRKPATS